VRKILLPLVFVFFAFRCFGAEYADGRIKLLIHENTGRFSLYFLSDPVGGKYSPLFVDQDPRTSFLALTVDGRNYRMGEASAFRMSLGGGPLNPALIFKSSFLTVVEDFTFTRSAGSSLSDGVRITITISNNGEIPRQVGVKLLFDTNLGEGGPDHFVTDRRKIGAEAVLDGTSEDRYWVSRSPRLGLRGDLSSGQTRPDLVHFANWKRLNEAPWKADFSEGRNFNFLPTSVGDSAVSYYYDPRTLEKGEGRTVTLVLSPVYGPGGSAGIPDRETVDADLAMLGDMLTKIDRYVSSGALPAADELAALESLVSRLKQKYKLDTEGAQQN
jgi:hypothetical protein